MCFPSPTSPAHVSCGNCVCPSPPSPCPLVIALRGRVIGSTVSEYYGVIRLPADHQALFRSGQWTLPKTDQHAAPCLGTYRASQVPDDSVHTYHVLDDPDGPSGVSPRRLHCIGFRYYDAVAIRIYTLNEAALDIQAVRSVLWSACFPVYASSALFAPPYGTPPQTQHSVQVKGLSPCMNHRASLAHHKLSYRTLLREPVYQISGHFRARLGRPVIKAWQDRLSQSPNFARSGYGPYAGMDALKSTGFLFTFSFNLPEHLNVTTLRADSIKLAPVDGLRPRRCP